MLLFKNRNFRSTSGISGGDAILKMFSLSPKCIKIFATSLPLLSEIRLTDSSKMTLYKNIPENCVIILKWLPLQITCKPIRPFNRPLLFTFGRLKYYSPHGKLQFPLVSA